MKKQLLSVLNKPFPLRYSVPALLIIFALALMGFLIGDGIRLSKKRIETEARLYLETLGQRTAARLEYYFSHNQAMLVEWEQALLSKEPHLQASAFFDEANRVLAANAKLKLPPDFGVLAAARKSAGGQMQLSADGGTLAGAFPVRLDVSRQGVLYLETSLREQKDLQLAEDFRRAEVFGGMALLLVLLATLYLDHILTWRVARLIAVTRGMAAGDLSRRSSLEGMDELAEIGQAFNLMAEQIQQRTVDLRESQGRYQRFVETAYEGIFAVDENLCVTFVNRRMAEMLGFTMDEMTGRSWNNFLFLEDAGSHQARMMQRQIGEAICYECRMRHKGGGEIWIIMSTTVSWDQTGQFAGLFGMATDITKRKQAEAQLQLQSSALTACANSIVITDANGCLEWVNPAFSRLTGYAAEEVIGKSTRILRSDEHSPEFYAGLWATVSAGKIWQGEIINKRKSGEKYTERMTITPVTATDGQLRHFVAVKEDITSQRRMEQHLSELQKMDAISQLAGGVAHEFNNIFTIIIGYSNKLRDSGRLLAEDCAIIEKIISTARRAAQVTRQLLVTGQSQPMQPQLLDLNETVGSMFNILKHLLGNKITVQCQLAETLPDVKADPSMIEKMIVNLATRARNALPEGGRVILNTQLMEFDKLAVAQSGKARCGRFVCLTIINSSPNVDETAAPQIFKPATNGIAKDSAKPLDFDLSLAAVNNIVQQHGGWVQLGSVVAQGSAIRIFLPVAETSEAIPSAANATLLPPIAEEVKTILLVEDDETLRKLTSAYLRRLNCRVLEAANGDRAQQLWQEYSESIDLLLTDIILPGERDGRQLAEDFQSRCAGLKVIYTSGYNQHGNEAAAFYLQAENYLPKPYDPETLARKVLDMLNDGDRSPMGTSPMA